MKPGNPFILLSVMSAVLASCTDLEYHEYIDLQPDMAAVNAGPAVSLRAEQSPDNVVTVTLNEGDGFTTAGLFARSNAPLSVSRTIQLKAGDEEMVEEYSRNTGVEYTLLPAPFYKFINGSTVDIPEGTAQSATKQLRLFAKNPLDNVLAPGRYLVLDGVQDPGNVGTVWRTADAFGADGVFLLPGCAEPFSPKTVRATMGACFRLPVWETGLERLTELLKGAGVPLYATALRADTADLGSADLSRAAVVIGSEGRGVSRPVLDACALTLRIPMRDRCESLNAAAAAAVVLWEGWRNR